MKVKRAFLGFWVMAGFCGLLACVLAAGLLDAASAQEAGLNITVDSGALTVSGDGDDDDKAFKGVPFVASVKDGVATFRVKGDLNVAATDAVKAVGPNAVSLVAGDDATVEEGATFDASATSAQPGPGGGRGGAQGDGGHSSFERAVSHPFMAQGKVVPLGLGGISPTPEGGGGGSGGVPNVTQWCYHPDQPPPLNPPKYETFWGDGCHGWDGEGTDIYTKTAGGMGELGERGDAGAAGLGAPGSGGMGGEGGHSECTGGEYIVLCVLTDRHYNGGPGSQSGAHGQGGKEGEGTGGRCRESGDRSGGNGTNGGDGVPGKDGGPGVPGKGGAGGKSASGTPNLTGGGGGGGGGGGQAGGGGDAGGPGGGGGGGGGGGAKCRTWSDVDDGGSGGSGGDGGDGGAGQSGGDGGLGGDGAPGGHGGGAIEVSALGRLSVAGTFLARGSAGGNSPEEGGYGGLPGTGGWRLQINAGYDGTEPRFGLEGRLGASGKDGGGKGGNGGYGGDGAPGGQGGQGGVGGRGGGGAGGTIKLSGSVVVAGGTLSVDTSGGSGGYGDFNAGANGRLVLAANAPVNLEPTLTKSTREDYAGPRKANPFVAGTPATPYLPGVEGDAEGFGILEGVTAEDFPTVRSGSPEGSPASLHRVDRIPDGEDFSGFDALLYINLSGRTLPSPAMGGGEAGFERELLTGGFATDPAFGGSGPAALSGIKPGEVYATLVPEGTTGEFGFSYNRSGVARSASAETLHNGETIYLSRFPDTGITAGPQGLINDATPSFEFSSEERSTFECRMDSASEAAFESCTSPLTSKRLAEGEHTFEVRATDLDGNTDQSPASRSFTVDSKAPVITLVRPTGGSATNDPTPDLSGNGGTADGDSDTVSVEIYTGNSTAGTPLETLNLSRSADGSYSGIPSGDLSDDTYTAIGAQDDAAGNTGRSTPVTFTVDTRRPVATITSSSGAEDATPTFELTSDETPSTFECRVDSASEADFKPCSSTFTTSRLQDGDHTLEVRATDRANNTGEAATHPFTVDTLPSIINDDEYSTEEDRRLVVLAADGVLNNDTDAEGDPLAATKLSDPQHGALTFAANGSFTYEPDQNYNGTDSFIYKANDGTKDGARTATMTVKIGPVNDAPTFKPGTDQAVDEDAGPQRIAGWATEILPGPPDEAAQGVSFTLTSDDNKLFSRQPAISPNGTLTFTPAKNASGKVAVKARARDDGGTSRGGTSESAQRVFTITVRAVNDAPLARDDSYKAIEDQSLSIVASSGVLRNDTDIEGDKLRAQVVAKPKHGTLNLRADGTLVYRPAKDYSGADRFTYAVSDGHGGKDTAAVTLRVASVPEPNPPDEGRGCTITGTGGRDVLRGTEGRDVICGLGGNDVIYGLGGADILYGDAGDDVLYGGAGEDKLDGGPGRDRTIQ